MLYLASFRNLEYSLSCCEHHFGGLGSELPAACIQHRCLDGDIFSLKFEQGSPRADHVSALDAKRILQARCMVRTRPMLPEEVRVLI